jgi:predicted Zn finger-like uncharacterized protein
MRYPWLVRDGQRALERPLSRRMDVTCNRCGTVYEFEEGLISTTGTTVKCTQCGHLFKVHRPSPLPPAGGLHGIAIEPSRWRVRRVDGSTHTLDSLADLSNLINAGQFGADDEISRTGQIWKRLGEIAELSSLFERPARARRMSEPPPQPQLPLAAAIEDAKRITASERPSSTSSDAPRRRVPTDPRFHMMGADVEVDSQRPSAPPAEPPIDEERATAPHPPQPAMPAAGNPISTPPAPAAASASQAAPAAPSSPPAPAAASVSAVTKAALDDALDDPMIDDVRRSDRGARLIMVVCGLLLAGGIGSAVFVQSRAASTATNTALSLLERGDTALAEHQPDAFQRSIGLYTQALALHPEDTHTLVSISRAYAIWSEWLRDDLQDKPADPAAALADNVARTESQRLADLAKQYAVRATRHASGLTEASVAHADALRLNGDLALARTAIERARASENAPSAETLRVAALLAIDSGGGVASAGRKLAEQAVALDPNLIRTRLLLARCMLDDNDAEGAQSQLDALRSLDASHPRLPRLAQQIEALRASQQPATRKGQAGAAPANPPAQPQPAQPQPQAQPELAEPQQAPVAPKPQAAAKPPPAAKPEESSSETNDPLELVRRGENALERGATQVAQSAFERALEIDPHLWRAKTGLGYLSLERNQPNAAIAYFRPAAQHGHAEALIGLGDALRRIGRTREALDAYNMYLKRFPDGARRSIAQHQSELLSEQLDSH